jgi:MFS family permease
MSELVSDAQNHAAESSSPWSPLRIRTFRYLWLATLISNTGTWMHDIGAGWLMTTLSSSPLMVALVQTAVTLPTLLLAIPAGALADIFDRRRYLITCNVWMLSTAGMLGVLTIFRITNEWILLSFTFALGAGTAMMMPAWQSVTPEVVPRQELHHAVGLNTMGMNVARAIGPALAGIIVASVGSGAVFLINAATFLFVIVVFSRWQPTMTPSGLPAERFIAAIRTGIRFARNSHTLHSALIRGASFFVFASALWALLPLIAKELLQGGPETFGILLASIGVGAIAGALIMPRFRTRFNSDQLVAGSSGLYAVSIFGIGHIHSMFFAVIAMGLCGMAWITVMTSIQTAAQLALPNWVRSRGLAVFAMVLMGSLAAGSVIWGKVAEHTSIATTLIIAAIATITAALATGRWQISGLDKADLTPSRHWRLPDGLGNVGHDRSPVMIMIHYDVLPGREAAFLRAARQLGKSRRRDGSYAWDILEDAATPGRFLEYFMVESWLDYLRQHERVTNTDRELQEHIRTLLKKGSSPKISHFVGPR